MLCSVAAVGSAVALFCWLPAMDSSLPFLSSSSRGLGFWLLTGFLLLFFFLQRGISDKAEEFGRRKDLAGGLRDLLVWSFFFLLI